MRYNGGPLPSRHDGAATRPRYTLALLLFVLTFLCATTLGVAWHLDPRIEAGHSIWFEWDNLRRAWTEGDLLWQGLSYSLPLLWILLCHEMGHYLACRYYRLPATLPYFIPLPAGFGTLGAFIRIRAPITRRRALFDVGVAGPLAGFAALLPFLVYGVAHSEPAELGEPQADGVPTLVLGLNLALTLLIRLFHGELGAGVGLNLHPFAVAAWVGLLATALNLLPLGQLDGGHILYATVGPLQRRLALPIWAVLGLGGVYWPGWLLWCFILLLMGIHHPPLQHRGEPLGPWRWGLAVTSLLLLLLTFMPVPISVVPLR